MLPLVLTHLEQSTK